MRKMYLIDELVAQWHKMRLALESQQQRLAEGQVEGERLTSEEYQARIGELVHELDGLIKAHASEHVEEKL